MTAELGRDVREHDVRHLDAQELLAAADEKVDGDLVVWVLSWAVSEADDPQVTYAIRRAVELRVKRQRFGGEPE